MNPELEQILRLKHRCVLPKVLLAAAECAPLSKTGGLADVAGALPKSLNDIGIETRVITPYHRCIKGKYDDKIQHICDFEINLGWRRQYVGLERLDLDGLVIYLVDNEFYFGDMIYRGGNAEGEQYAFFQRAVLECIPRLDDFEPEVLHCNDWHTALLPFLIKSQYGYQPQGRLKTVLTIHNIAYQGKFDFGYIQEMLGIDSIWYRPSDIEHFGCINFLKAGCVFADRVNTVSPSYANEIRTPAFGEGLQDVLACRGSDLGGIINGLDTDSFDPRTDPALPFLFDGDATEFKAKNKAALMDELGLRCPPDTPLVAMVTRMTSQKGFDLVMESIDRIMQRNVAFVLLGTGDKRYEDFMRSAEYRYHGRLCSYLSYSEALSRRIYAGADLFLMPSAFEPCGLSQMIAMRYGALPIVHEVGGLRDTVQPYNCFEHTGNGFSFAIYNSGVMLGMLDYALETWWQPDARAGLIERAMNTDFSFAPSALEYGRLFVSILDCADCHVFHDPFDEDYRTPLGAVKCGDKVTLRLRVQGGADDAELITGDGALPMKRTDDGFEIVYTTPDTPQVVWYSFRLFGSVCCGADGVTSGYVRSFQLTVYDKNFTTPDWANGAVMYQIFPDRWRREGTAPVKGAAYHRALGRNIQMHKSWDEPVKWQGGQGYYPDDFYGGTLLGVEKSLPELKEMGVSIVYLNPIFEADSNHRYNTASYLKIDPILGTNAAFKKLCRAADELGMKIVLDGVFSHTGDDSVYFDRRGVYDGDGAYQSEDSPYHSWYDFHKFPDEYRCWWGFKSLPEVNEGDPAWQDFVISGDKSVIKTWLRAGTNGYRLDVADELPDETLELLRDNVKNCDSDAIIIGEVWEDATTKVSYGQHRRYALGTALDSVMNYPLRGALIDFALGKMDAFALRNFLLGQKLNYPAPMYRCLMNLLSTHDTARVRTVLGSGGCDGGGMGREQQAGFTLSPEQNARGRALQKLCAVLQFTLPGMPCVYYGDEEGMQGMRDPFCRGAYVKNDGELRELYSKLANARNTTAVLKTGDAAFFAPNVDTICLLRFKGKKAFLIAANRAGYEQVIQPSASDFRGALRKQLATLPEIPEITVPAVDAVVVKL